MSKDSFNAPTVPHYAAPTTRPLRPRPPKELPEWLIDKKIARMKIYTAIFKWIRENWSDGDTFFMGEGAPNVKCYNLLNRFGCYNGLKAQGGGQTRVMVTWLDNGHKINPEVTTFYRCARKIVDGEEVELPRIDWAAIHTDS